MRRKTGRKPTHGAFSLVMKNAMIQDRKRLARYLRDVREGMIADFGGERGMTTAQKVLVDRVLTKLGTLRLIELWIAKNGIFKEEGELRSVLERYLSWSRELRNDLNALGINVRKKDDAFDVVKYAKERYGSLEGEIKNGEEDDGDRARSDDREEERLGEAEGDQTDET